MTTVRQIERFWNAADNGALIAHLCADRPEFAPIATDRAKVIAAALAVIRIDEFGQSFHPLAARLIRSIVAGQEADGGWGDVLPTVLALRALACSRGDGLAIENGMHWLAELQKDDGAWPAGPPRRLPADAATTVFVLMHLGQHARLRAAARVGQAMKWLEANEEQLDPAGKRLAQRALLRCRSVRQPAPPREALFSEAA